MGFGVFCLILDHCSCLSETRRPSAVRGQGTSACVCVRLCVCARKPACLPPHLCVFTRTCCCVCFRSWGFSLLTGSVSGGGQWRFWDGHQIRVSERWGGRKRRPLSCDSAFHQGTGRQRHKTRHASPLRLPSLPSPPPLLHPLPPHLPFFAQPPPPLPTADDLNIYQRAPCWNSS